MATPPAPGIYVPVPTFFKSAPSQSDPIPEVDLELQLKHGLYLARNGITGLVLLGSSGEAIGLTESERSKLISYVREGLSKEGFENYPIIVGTTAQGLEDVAGQLKAAAEAGADYGMVLAPGFFASGGGAAGIQQWFEAVADKSPIPIMIYHYPGVSNNIAISPATFAALAKHKNIVGCKLSHGNLSHTAQIASNTDTDHDHFVTFTGLGAQLVPVLSIGGVGAIDGLAGAYPKLVVRLFKLGQKPEAGTKKEMLKLQYEVAQAYELFGKWGVVGIKAATRVGSGLGSEHHVRLPLVGSDEPAREFAGVLQRLKDLENGY